MMNKINEKKVMRLTDEQLEAVCMTIWSDR